MKVETIQDPLLREIRYLDKLVDELGQRASPWRRCCGRGEPAKPAVPIQKETLPPGFGWELFVKKKESHCLGSSPLWRDTQILTL